MLSHSAVQGNRLVCYCGEVDGPHDVHRAILSHRAGAGLAAYSYCPGWQSRSELDQRNGPCPTCHNLEKDHRTYLYEIKQAEQLWKCHYCGLLLDAIQHFKLAEGLHGEVTGAGSQEWIYENEIGERCTWIPEEAIEVVIMVQPADPENGHPARFLFYLSGRGSSPYVQLHVTAGCDSPWPSVKPAAIVPRYSSDDGCFDTIQQWMIECSEKHSKCSPSTFAAPLPSRLLDVSNNEIRLMITQGLSGKYLTLSHCWGNPDDQVKTLRSNIEERKTGIAASELNQNYQDAVKITRKLGFQYLWIDSLCIVQDDPDDWAKESGAMAKIYASSFLTICASRAASGESGIFSDRQDAKNLSARDTTHLMSWSKTINTRTESGSEKQSVIYARVLHGHYFHGFSSFDAPYENKNLRVWRPADPSEEPLFTRAWAFQERIMAKRTLDYHAVELVWECQEMRRCECGEADRRGLDTPKKRFADALLELSRPVATEEHSGTGRKPSQNVWLKLVETYSTLALTFTSDRLPALSGLAQVMAPAQGGSYIAGFWQRDLPSALLWSPSPEGRGTERGSNRSDRDSTAKPKPRKREVPSWSWVSMEAPIVFSDIGDYASTRFVAQIEEIHAPPLTSDPYGQCSEARLTINGPFVEAKLKYNRKRYEKFWVSTETLWFPVSPDLDHSTPGTEYWLDSSTDVGLLEIARTRSLVEKSHGLILRATRKDEMGTQLYERLGTFERKGNTTALLWKQEKIVWNRIFTPGDVRTVVIV